MVGEILVCVIPVCLFALCKIPPHSAGNRHGTTESTASGSRRVVESVDDGYANSLLLSCCSDGSSELSSEIRGERLRFVEAMKEATAINVQGERAYTIVRYFKDTHPDHHAVHVEQFKKELNREVMVMTREIERLHREKQAVENQIADLFAFYSKHKHPVKRFSHPVSGMTNDPSTFKAHGVPSSAQLLHHAPTHRHPQPGVYRQQHLPGYHMAS